VSPDGDGVGGRSTAQDCPRTFGQRFAVGNFPEPIHFGVAGIIGFLGTLANWFHSSKKQGCEQRSGRNNK
jgi:hypothetical protein